MANRCDIANDDVSMFRLRHTDSYMEQRRFKMLGLLQAALEAVSTQRRLKDAYAWEWWAGMVNTKEGIPCIYYAPEYPIIVSVA